MVIFRSNFSVFLSFNTHLTHLNASNLLNFDPSNRFLPIASQSWCSGVSKMATYIYIFISPQPRGRYGISPARARAIYYMSPRALARGGHIFV